MDSGELIALTGLALGALVTVVLIAGAWALGRQHERRDQLARSLGNEDSAMRLARMERMLETLSTDVERILDKPMLPSQQTGPSLRSGRQ